MLIKSQTLCSLLQERANMNYTAFKCLRCSFVCFKLHFLVAISVIWSSLVHVHHMQVSTYLNVFFPLMYYEGLPCSMHLYTYNKHCSLCFAMRHIIV